MIYLQIFTQTPTFGKNSKERDTSVGEIISELTIIKEQLKHPNIVRYYKTFVERKYLIVMSPFNATVKRYFDVGS